MTPRVFHLLLVVGALFGVGSLCAAEPLPDLPLRKAGLWDVKTESDEGAGPRQQRLTMCIGEELERSSVISSGIENRANCSQYAVKKLAGSTIVDATCAYDQRQVTNHTELSGDFETSFAVKVVSTTAGKAPRSQGGQPINVHRTILQEGKYLGESCGDLNAGEAKTADGAKVTVQ